MYHFPGVLCVTAPCEGHFEVEFLRPGGLSASVLCLGYVMDTRPVSCESSVGCWFAFGTTRISQLGSQTPLTPIRPLYPRQAAGSDYKACVIVPWR